uniref:Uncharacterized protein n=1 Tax=Ascaris lumbricoides TaxID=6252 RepID=A0A0M3ICR8_ASCLU
MVALLAPAANERDRFSMRQGACILQRLQLLSSGEDSAHLKCLVEEQDKLRLELRQSSVTAIGYLCIGHTLTVLISFSAHFTVD